MSALDKYLEIRKVDTRAAGETQDGHNVYEIIHDGLYESALVELDTLRAQLAEAIEIIKPFAAESEMWGSKTPDEETPTIRGKDGKGDEAVFTVGDLRAAARFLDKVTTA